MNKTIYMDYQSTTPLDPRISKEMLKYFTEKFGNPHSKDHSYGKEAAAAIEIARNQIAKFINTTPKKIIFTSGATESNNIAIKGLASYYQKTNKNHIITIITEHKSVIEPCRFLEQAGFKVTYLPVDKEGIVNINKLEKSIRKSTFLISVMLVNNEIGVMQPLNKIANICKKNNIHLHTDAAQAFGKIHINLQNLNIDLLSISGHKIYGPKGVGVLYVNDNVKTKIKPLFHGGGQERNLRSGTLPTPLIVGLGLAAEIASKEIDINFIKITKLSNFFLDSILKINHVKLNGSFAKRFPGCINLQFNNIRSDILMKSMKNISVSSGSACTSESIETSHVLRALGLNQELTNRSIRFGFGKFTTKKDVKLVINTIINILKT